MILEKALLLNVINIAKINTTIIEVGGFSIALDSAIEYLELLKSKSETFFRYLPKEEIKTKGIEKGYTFNSEGNQVSYQYETEIETKLLFDKEKYKSKEKEILLDIDNISDKIDELFMKKKFSFQPKFFYLDSVKDILSKRQNK